MQVYNWLCFARYALTKSSQSWRRWRRTSPAKVSFASWYLLLLIFWAWVSHLSAFYTYRLLHIFSEFYIAGNSQNVFSLSILLIHQNYTEIHFCIRVYLQSFSPIFVCLFFGWVFLYIYNPQYLFFISLKVMIHNILSSKWSWKNS